MPTISLVRPAAWTSWKAVHRALGEATDARVDRNGIADRDPGGAPLV